MQDSCRSKACPFLERRDGRCADRFKLQHLAEMFDQCLDKYEACDVYHEINTPVPIEDKAHAVTPVT